MRIPGGANDLTDIPGLTVGQAEDARLGSGVTAVIFDAPSPAAVDIRGAAPGTRECDLLAPEATVAAIDALVLSGGSAFGLDAASGVQQALREAGRGFAVGNARVPIVPAAILFDLNGPGDKGWEGESPYRALGYAAAKAAGAPLALGTAGAGYGATTANLKGGLGSASALAADGVRVAALVAVNALGQATIGDGPHFWAAPYEQDGEFGGLGWPSTFGAPGDMPMKGASHNTTIAIVATDAALDKSGCRRLAVMAQDGLARALRPVHTALDGDLVFAAATGHAPAPASLHAAAILGTLAADCLARAIARAVFAATALPGGPPAWREVFGQKG